MKRACVILADGCEEVEAITPVDYLRRAGVEVTTAGLCGRDVEGSHGIAFAADAALDEVDEVDYDCVVVPGGGKGSAAIAADAGAVAFIRRHADAGRLVAAICAAPAVVLGEACGLLAGRRFTCYLGLETKVDDGVFVADRVVVDGNLVTARAAGCAGEFSVAIVRALLGDDPANALAAAVLL